MILKMNSVSLIKSSSQRNLNTKNHQLGLRSELKLAQILKMSQTIKLICQTLMMKKIR